MNKQQLILQATDEGTAQAGRKYPINKLPEETPVPERAAMHIRSVKNFAFAEGFALGAAFAFDQLAEAKTAASQVGAMTKNLHGFQSADDDPSLSELPREINRQFDENTMTPVDNDL